MFAPMCTDIKNFWVYLFSKMDVGDCAKKIIECCVCTTHRRIKSFLPLFFSKKRAGLGAAPHNKIPKGYGAEPHIKPRYKRRKKYENIEYRK